MKKQLIKQLESMTGKTYQYGGRIHYVQNVSFPEGKEVFKIKTNLGDYERPFENGTEFLGYWEEAQSMTQTPVVVDPQPQQNPLMERETNMVDTLTDLLMDNIRKVQETPEYIKQAQAINNNINSIINLTKLKLDVIKQSRGRR